MIMCVIGWVLCSIVAYGWSLGFFQWRFPSIAEENKRSDMWFFGLLSLLGPFNLIAFVIFLLCSRENMRPRFKFY